MHGVRNCIGLACWVVAFAPQACADVGELSDAYLRPPAIRLVAAASGVRAVSAAALQQAGAPLADIDPRTLRLYYRGREAPLVVRAQADALAPADHLYVWVPPPPDRYAPHTVLWLRWGENEGRQATSIPAAPPATSPDAAVAPVAIHVEPQVAYWPMLPDGEGKDHWFAARAGYGQPHTFTWGHPAAAPDVAAKITVRLYGLSRLPQDPDHHALIKLNGQVIADRKWDDQTEVLLEAEVPAGTLKPAENELSIEAVEDLGIKFDFFFVDWADAAYDARLTAHEDQIAFLARGAGAQSYVIDGFSDGSVEVFRLDQQDRLSVLEGVQCKQTGDSWQVGFADKGAPVGARYVAATTAALARDIRAEPATAAGLRQLAEPVDYLVVAPSQFHDALKPLIEFRRQRGLTPLLVTPEAVYDEFDYGHKGPRALREFAHHRWEAQPEARPRFLLLVGDSSYDTRRYNPKAAEDILPTYQAHTVPFGDTGSDEWLVSWGEQQPVPQMAVGRIPARTAEEVATVVGKIMRYEQQDTGAPWRRKALLVADNDEALFAGICDQAADALGPKWDTTKAYMAKPADAPQVKKILWEGFNDGCGLILYVGHAQTRNWAHEGIFSADDVAKLNNGEKLPFVIGLTCLDGFFHHALVTRCTAEELLLAPNGGVIAQWSPTGMGYSRAHGEMLNALWQAANDHGQATLGELVMQAKRQLLTNHASARNRDVTTMYVFFGDPALSAAPLFGGG